MIACKDKVICPAFQSTYILDDSVRMAYFSYVWKLDEVERTKYLTSINQPKDTSNSLVIPAGGKIDYYAYAEKYVVPPREVNKSKYGIVKYEPYWLKNYHLKTGPMENVLTPDAPEYPKMDTASVDVGEFVASDFTDSLAVDSSSVAMVDGDIDSLQVEEFELPTLAKAPPPPKKEETKYLYRFDPKDEMLNVEQAYYNKYFGEYLVAKPRKVVSKPVIEEREPEPNIEVPLEPQSEDELIDRFATEEEPPKKEKKPKKEKVKVKEETFDGAEEGESDPPTETPSNEPTNDGF
jgi:hypothetical protein